MTESAISTYDQNNNKRPFSDKHDALVKALKIGANNNFNLLRIQGHQKLQQSSFNQSQLG